MTEQQYRVVADNIDPNGAWDSVEDGDRVVVVYQHGEFLPVRIERPVPPRPLPVIVTDLFPDDEDQPEPSPSAPTREQIALFLARFEGYTYTSAEGMPDWRLNQAGAVLALIQNGADR